MPISTIPEVLDDLRRGKMIILVDDPGRENEGDLAMLAEHVSAGTKRAKALKASRLASIVGAGSAGATARDSPVCAGDSKAGCEPARRLRMPT